MSLSSPAQPTTPSVGLGDRLSAHVSERQSQIVLGLDPDPLALWPSLSGSDDPRRDGDGPSVSDVSRAEGHDPRAEGHDSRAGDGSVRAQVAAQITAQCVALIDAAGQACVAVKPQLARFEALGAPGWAALEAVVAHARQAGLLVIADAKRGDIDVSARAYAQALTSTTDTAYGPVRGLGADMITVNPLLGADALQPFIATARQAGAGLLVLVRTSNPGAADIQDLELATGERVWERIAKLVDELASHAVGESGLSDVGAVFGATVPEHLARARQLMPSAIFLLPGVGAQGGRVEDLGPAFASGRAAGLITASRSIANAHRTHGGDPASAARAEAERLRELAWQFT